MRWMLSSTEEQSQLQESQPEEAEKQPGDCCSVKRTLRVLRPTSEQLKSLNLKFGCNSIEYAVTSSLQGTQTVKGSIYFWPARTKILISDVDGTITKSDVLGQLFPVIGRDWSHEGVARLFSKCVRNNYKIIYLTARAIGQADPTRDYLFGLRQEQAAQLPDGPLIMSPDRLFSSFRREVIDRKPYVFKIAALKDIRNLFPRDYNPFYAGFGNRDTDHRSYVHIGCPEARVFIIDTKGKLHHVNHTYAQTYASMSDMVEHMFPPVPSDSGDGGYLGEEEQVRRRKRLTPEKFYESWTAEAANRRLRLEDGTEIIDRSGLFSCCSQRSSSTFAVNECDTASTTSQQPKVTVLEIPSSNEKKQEQQTAVRSSERSIGSKESLEIETTRIGYAIRDAKADRDTSFNMPSPFSDVGDNQIEHRRREVRGSKREECSRFNDLNFWKVGYEFLNDDEEDEDSEDFSILEAEMARMQADQESQEKALVRFAEEGTAEGLHTDDILSPELSHENELIEKSDEDEITSEDKDAEISCGTE
ncbi:uncharacterized protein LOC129617183, partial [Condylostylus longicornis]|uniref:uncharacterized protein LOC129617183 n=1 Tax=Condylostylus longicornis TaxID=2530218 RepID=UPI00244E1353